MEMLMIAAICVAVVLVLSLAVWYSMDDKAKFDDCPAAMAAPSQCINSQGTIVEGAKGCSSDKKLFAIMMGTDEQSLQQGAAQQRVNINVPPASYSSPEQPREMIIDTSGVYSVPQSGAQTSVIALLQEQDVAETGAVAQSSVVSAFYGGRY